MDEGVSTQIDRPSDLLESEHLEMDLIAGYVATSKDREELNCDWEIVDGEGWPA
jgi:hypothetical protein